MIGVLKWGCNQVRNCGKVLFSVMLYIICGIVVISVLIVVYFVNNNFMFS